jgi:diguanylate cyclase (GGDEF)-like protein
VLRHIATLLRSAIRTTDLVGRLGGEEFILLLPLTTQYEGLQMADKLRILVEMSPTKIPPNRLGHTRVPATLSMGVVGLAGSESADLISLYSQADKALYRAKHEGRNRVEGATPKDAISQLEA